jgi:hypothetical protein
MTKKREGQMTQRLVAMKLVACATFLALGFMSCHTDDSTRPSPVYLANHSTLTLWIEVSQTREFDENTVQDYSLNVSDSLFLGYFPNGYSFWLWGLVDDARAADTSRFIEYPVEVAVSGKTLLTLDDSLGEPVLRVFH